MVGGFGPNGPMTEFVSGGMFDESVNIKELEAFARLIVERCAESLDALGCDHCAAATRNLLED